MGRTNEFTLVADGDFAGKLGYAVKVKAETLVHNTPVGTLAGAGEAIDGIVTDITAGNPQVLAVAKVGDIVFATIGTGGAKVGDELAVEDGGKLVKQTSQAKTVAKALATGNAHERIPVIIK